MVTELVAGSDLVHDDVCQGVEEAVLLELTQQNPGGAVQQAGGVARAVLHTDLVPAERGLETKTTSLKTNKKQMKTLNLYYAR